MSALALLLTLVGAPAAAHAGHGPAAPWDLCAESDLGDACAWESAERDLYRGTCRSMSGALVCVRNQPIIQGAARQRARWVSAAGLAGAALMGALAWRLRRVRAQRFSTCS